MAAFQVCVRPRAAVARATIQHARTPCSWFLCRCRGPFSFLCRCRGPFSSPRCARAAAGRRGRGRLQRRHDGLCARVVLRGVAGRGAAARAGARGRRGRGERRVDDARVGLLGAAVSLRALRGPLEVAADAPADECVRPLGIQPERRHPERVLQRGRVRDVGERVGHVERHHAPRRRGGPARRRAAAVPGRGQLHDERRLGALLPDAHELERVREPVPDGRKQRVGAREPRRVGRGRAAADRERELARGPRVALLRLVPWRGTGAGGWQRRLGDALVRRGGVGVRRAAADVRGCGARGRLCTRKLPRAHGGDDRAATRVILVDVGVLAPAAAAAASNDADRCARAPRACTLSRAPRGAASAPAGMVAIPSSVYRWTVAGVEVGA